MVAGNLLPGTGQKDEPSRRDGVIRSVNVVLRSGPTGNAVIKIIPSLRDGIWWCIIPGNKLPGYDQLVPSGQRSTGPPGQVSRPSSA